MGKRMDATKVIGILLVLLIALVMFQTFQLINVFRRISTTSYATASQAQLPTGRAATPALPAQRGGC